MSLFNQFSTRSVKNLCWLERLHVWTYLRPSDSKLLVFLGLDSFHGCHCWWRGYEFATAELNSTGVGGLMIHSHFCPSERSLDDSNWRGSNVIDSFSGWGVARRVVEFCFVAFMMLPSLAVSAKLNVLPGMIGRAIASCSVSSEMDWLSDGLKSKCALSKELRSTRVGLSWTHFCVCWEVERLAGDIQDHIRWMRVCLVSAEALRRHDNTIVLNDERVAEQ